MFSTFTRAARRRGKQWCVSRTKHNYDANDMVEYGFTFFKLLEYLYINISSLSLTPSNLINSLDLPHTCSIINIQLNVKIQHFKRQSYADKLLCKSVRDIYLWPGNTCYTRQIDLNIAGKRCASSTVYLPTYFFGLN